MSDILNENSVIKKFKEANQRKKMLEVLPFYKNAKRPICRLHINGGCKYGSDCKFYHPEFIIKMIKRTTRRKTGLCYCGHKIKCVHNRKCGKKETNYNRTFYRLCARTGNNIKSCKYYSEQQYIGH
jgi:hypothetical protein